MKIALGIEYQGTNYHGWQRQHKFVSVQEIVETAIASIVNHPIEMICAGRTDARVHALGQVVHFETEVQRPDTAWVMGTNSILPKDIKILWFKYVTDDFHARYSATYRRYRYVVYNHPVSSAIYADLTTWNFKRFDIAAMRESAKCLQGKNDFSSFRASDCQANTPVRNLHFIKISQKDHFIFFDVEANAFLHHMVRNIVGTLMMVGEGKKTSAWVKEVLDAKDRKAAGITAPATGLYMVEVGYPSEFQLPMSSCKVFE